MTPHLELTFAAPSSPGNLASNFYWQFKPASRKFSGRTFRDSKNGFDNGRFAK